ncbi:MAG: UDP-N-acetylmuramoyl-tripeptide--D-alanyl-D-alanine ligase, partial [Polyangiaceae bacterium]
AWKSRGGRVVAITGSAGKTTTKEMCASLLARVGAVHATAGNLNNRIGVPAVVLGLEKRHAFAVIEMGMSEPGEIARLVEIAPPDAAVVTNVGLAHAGGVGGDEDDVAREKGAIFTAIHEGGTAVVNADDARVALQGRRASGHVVTFGRAPSADYRLANRESLGARGSRVTIARGGESIAVDLPVVGEAAAMDFAAALAAAEAVAQKRFDRNDIAAAAASLQLPPGRASVRSLADGTLVIDDSYNANPDSMRSAIRALAEIAAREGRRAVAVIGEMRELGPRAEAEHAALGDDLVAAKVSLVIGCGGLADLAIDRAAAAGVQVFRAKNARNAAKIAVSEIGPKDVVLVKASRGVAAEVVVDALIEARGGARS